MAKKEVVEKIFNNIISDVKYLKLATYFIRKNK